jgi:cytochrome c oxidase cbb3-type subunit 2
MNFNFHENPRLLFLVVFLGFVILTIIIGVSPAIWIQDHTSPLPGSKELTEREQRGLNIYIAEGCAYCHTQQVRPLDVDKPFGRPSAPGDYARLKPQDLWRMTPALLGTERTGPDLCDLASRQSSEAWHYIHLYNPRAVVKDSIMQAYPWMFATKTKADPNDSIITVPPDYAPQEGAIVATEKAGDLVAYLLTLKQLPIPGSAPIGQERPAQNRGAAVYASHCASCHGLTGEGVPGVFPPMKGDAVVMNADPTLHIKIVLAGLSGATINGVRYSAAMPGHASELSDEDIAAVINHERTSWGNSARIITTEDVAKTRKITGG